MSYGQERRKNVDRRSMPAIPSFLEMANNPPGVKISSKSGPGLWEPHFVYAGQNWFLMPLFPLWTKVARWHIFKPKIII
jgi:hypothetical protein